MAEHVILISVPGLRGEDLELMPRLRELTLAGDRGALGPSFPCVTCPVQANMTTGCTPAEHGVVANGFYWREKNEIEMWTAWNDCIERPQIWDLLHERSQDITSAVWFPLHSKGCGADYICTPAPVHNPDGTESLWCYTKPSEMYGELRDAIGHFPLKHFWGPMANIKSSEWIMQSALLAAEKFKPNFFYIYVPHLDYAAQKIGPNSDQARQAVIDLDASLGLLVDGMRAAYRGIEPLWMIASEYTISPVDHVLYPNRVLRQEGLLTVKTEDSGGEILDTAASKTWALADHQFSHIFVRENDTQTVAQVRALFENREGVDEVLSGEQLARYDLNHPRSGSVVIVSTPNSWQAYYYWMDDAQAPSFARTVDIHRKPGYDPVELHIDMATKSIPLDATLVGGSHGAPARQESQRGVILTSQPGILLGGPVADTDVADLVVRQFGV